MTTEQRSIVVTGGAGFIGSHLVRRLVGAGYRVGIITRRETDLTRISDIRDRVSLYSSDLSNPEELRLIMQTAQPSGVFHLAAANIASGITDGDEAVVRTNILGTVNLLNSLAPYSYDFFITTGSFLEYGLINRPVKETDPCLPTELYSISKLAATLYSQAVAKRENRPIVCFRLFTPYGPNIQPGRLVYEVITKALRGEEITLTAPTITRDFIFVEDIVDLYMESMGKARDQASKVFNLGTGTATALAALVDVVKQLTGSNSPIAWGSAKAVSYDQALWQADMTETFRQFTWRPHYPLVQGLEKTIAWRRTIVL